MKKIFFAEKDPRFGGIPAKNEATLRVNKSQLLVLFKIADLKTSLQLFSYKFWEEFFASGKIALSAHNCKKEVEYSKRCFRVEVLDKFFNEFKSRRDLLSPAQIRAMRKIKIELIVPLLEHLNKARVADMGAKKTKLTEENTSLVLSLQFARYAIKKMASKPMLKPSNRIAAIYVLQNALSGVRPSGLSKMKITEWEGRRHCISKKFKGWVQVTVRGMKNAKTIAPHVSISPEVAALIEKYIEIRPNNPCPFLFVSTEKSKGGVPSSAVTTLMNNHYYKQWRAEVASVHTNLPKTFRFNSQRHNVQTEARHNPQKGQPPPEVIDDFLGHDGKTGREVYKNKLSSANHMGAAVWAYSMLNGEHNDFAPIQLEFVDNNSSIDDDDGTNNSQISENTDDSDD